VSGVDIGLLMILFIILFLFTFVLILSFKGRKQVSEMDGMTTAMTVGMMSGITIGTIIGIVCQGHIFHSTVIGMVIGMVMGFLVGIPLRFSSLMNGLVSGVMGGMMGAMLGEMMPNEYQSNVIKIMLLLYIFCLILVIKTLLDNTKTHHSSNFSLLSLFILFTFILTIIPLDFIEILRCIGGNEGNHIH
jgi:hypothetical protein